MRLFKRRRQRTSKSPLTKAKEQEAKLNTHLMKVYLDDLKANPTYAREIAREKYGLSSGSMDDYVDRSDDSGLDTYRKWRKMVKEEAEEEKPSSSTIEAVLNSEAGKAVAEGLMKMMIPQMQQQQISLPPRITRVEPEQIAQPEPEQIAEPEPKSQEEKLTSFIEQLMTMTPTEAALNIYQHKDNLSDIRYMIYSYVTENDFDSIVDSIPMITTSPNNKFLVPLAGKLDRKWMALVYDELSTLRKKEELQ